MNRHKLSTQLSVWTLNTKFNKNQSINFGDKQVDTNLEGVTSYKERTMNMETVRTELKLLVTGVETLFSPLKERNTVKVGDESCFDKDNTVTREAEMTGRRLD